MHCRQLISFAAFAAGLAVLACSESNFGVAGSKTNTVTPGEGGSTPDCATETAGCPTPLPQPVMPPSLPTPAARGCVQGDSVSFNWTGREKSCIVDQGKTYNFDTQQCAEMRKAQFLCNWQSVRQELGKRGLLSDKLKADSDAGAKLVTCGESQDGNRIVVQWIIAANSSRLDCNYKSGAEGIVTGCYTNYTTGNAPPPTTDPAVQAKQVYDCMNQL